LTPYAGPIGPPDRYHRPARSGAVRFDRPAAAAQAGNREPPIGMSEEPYETRGSGAYCVDFDDFFVEYLLDEVVTSLDEVVAVKREDI
jgi:hypothetical protein